MAERSLILKGVAAAMYAEALNENRRGLIDCTIEEIYSIYIHANYENGNITEELLHHIDSEPFIVLTDNEQKLFEAVNEFITNEKNKT